MLNSENIPTNGKSPADELWEELGSENRRAMKRCFMTGKQCIFSSKKRNDDKSSTKKIFAIMPFSPNLETFYQWSLKPFLTTKSGYSLDESQVQRADEVHDLGYIVCEKICRKIQESSLVLAEISLKNQNVFYEIGLAYGLERPIVFMRNADIKEDVLEDPCIKQIIYPRTDTDADERILEYPNVRPLSYEMEKFRLHRYIYRPWESRILNKERPKRDLRISALKINQIAQPKESSLYGSDEEISHDINLDFDEVISGAINVAMTEIKLASEPGQSEDEPWAKAVKGLEDSKSQNTLWKDFSRLHQIKVDSTSSYNEIANSIESSFCTIIDVSGDNRESSTAYFWLGFCHARGINAIPVYRTNSHKSKYNNAPNRANEPKLAFDIRSLWYAQYDESKPYEFKDKIREILERLFERDLPNRQKRAFWDRFSREKRLKIFTGAIHIDDLNREMVGDWDVRAVSELFAYLSSAQETMDIELVTPFYSPYTSFKGSIGDILYDIRESKANIEDILKELAINEDELAQIIETSIDSAERKIKSSEAEAESTRSFKDTKSEIESYKNKLFDWNRINDDNERGNLETFLSPIDWIKKDQGGEIETGSNKEIITLLNRNKNRSLKLKLDNEISEVMLEVDNGSNTRFIAREENNALNIYYNQDKLELDIGQSTKSAIIDAVKLKLMSEECSKKKEQVLKAGFLIKTGIESAKKIMGEGLIKPTLKSIIEFLVIEAAKISFVDDFCKDIDENLSDSNAIIIASPDVNQVAEFLLNRIYGVMKSDLQGEKKAFIDEPSTYTGYKVFKEIEPPEDSTAINSEGINGSNIIKYMPVRTESDEEDNDNEYIEVIPKGNMFPSEFYIEAYRKKKRDPEKPLKRGFVWHASIENVIYSDLIKPYYAQTTRGDSFDLLGQLVIARYYPARNPAKLINESNKSTESQSHMCKDIRNMSTNIDKNIKQKDDSSLVVLLNGVSGPATFALAQILTGSVLERKPEMNSDSEKMLGKINDLLDQNPDASIEGIVEVKIDRSNKDKLLDAFNWDDLPEKDGERLKVFLAQKFGIDWVKSAIIEKIDEDRKIKISNKDTTQKREILLDHNNKTNDVILKIDGKINSNFIAKKEQKMLNIYEKPLQMHCDTRKVQSWYFKKGPKLIKKCHVN